ncbi:MAG: hypothetical protein JSS02_21905, partial [Planctomycetes bacterium]|nr:hypothetical protein [Planctomycetota bacterium]
MQRLAIYGSVDPGTKALVGISQTGQLPWASPVGFSQVGRDIEMRRGQA